MSNSGNNWTSIPSTLFYTGAIIVALYNFAKSVIIKNDLKLCTVYSNNFAIGNKYLIFLATLQSILIIFLLVFMYKSFSKIEILLSKNNKETFKEKVLLAESIIQSFFKKIILLCISWLLLYLWFSFCWSFGKIFFGKYHDVIFWIVADLFHSSTALIFFYIYFFVENPYSNKAINRMQGTMSSNLVSVGILTLTFLTISILGRLGYFNFDKIGPICLSFWVGIAMQYFMSTLESLTLGVHRRLFTPLYLYVLIQIMWSVIGGYLSNDETIIILYITFILKIYFIVLFIIWLRKNSFSKYFFRILNKK